MNKVTYISHSCYMVETKTAVFLFDYYKGILPEFPKEKEVYVFASHNHYDHFKKKIFFLSEEDRLIRFILSDDIPQSVQTCKEAAEVKQEQIFFMGPNEERQIGNCKVRTLRSTDEGVAFLIHYENTCIYHGGDLNWWHWNQESETFNELMKRNFQYEISKFEQEKIDLAFLPLDSRMEESYAYGFDYFMRHTETKWVFPMHFWEDYRVCQRLLEEPYVQGYKKRIQKIEQPGQEFEFPE